MEYYRIDKDVAETTKLSRGQRVPLKLGYGEQSRINPPSGLNKWLVCESNYMLESLTLVLKYRGRNIIEVGLRLSDFIETVRISHKLTRGSGSTIIDLPTEFLDLYSEYTEGTTRCNYFRIPVLSLAGNIFSEGYTIEFIWKQLPAISPIRYSKLGDPSLVSVAASTNQAIHDYVRHQLTAELFFNETVNYSDTGFRLIQTSPVSIIPNIKLQRLAYNDESVQRFYISDSPHTPKTKYLLIVTEFDNDALVDSVNLTVDGTNLQFGVERETAAMLDTSFQIDTNCYGIDIEAFITAAHYHQTHSGLLDVLGEEKTSAYEKFRKRMKAYNKAAEDEVFTFNKKDIDIAIDVNLSSNAKGIARVYITDF